MAARAMEGQRQFAVWCDDVALPSWSGVGGSKIVVPATIPAIPASRFRALHVHHDVVFFDADWHRLRHQMAFQDLAALGDFHRIAPRPDRIRVRNGMAGADVEFPTMPGASQNLAAASVDIITGFR